MPVKGHQVTGNYDTHEQLVKGIMVSKERHPDANNNAIGALVGISGSSVQRILVRNKPQAPSLMKKLNNLWPATKVCE